MSTKLLYTVPEAADVLSLGTTKVYELIAADRLESVKVGRARRVPADALQRFVELLRDIKEDGDAT